MSCFQWLVVDWLSDWQEFLYVLVEKIFSTLAYIKKLERYQVLGAGSNPSKRQPKLQCATVDRQLCLPPHLHHVADQSPHHSKLRCATVDQSPPPEASGTLPSGPCRCPGSMAIQVSSLCFRPSSLFLSNATTSSLIWE
jgi:hypothetical protein